jgi:hypothetical protein
METGSLTAMTDDELLRRLGELLRSSRRIESELVAHIAEVDRRRLYAREATPSMFAYCTEVLHLSEAEAYLRIAVARASREHPVLLAMLADGSLHLTGIALLAPHLTAETRGELLRRATHRSKRQIEELIANLAPRPEVPDQIRKLPERGALKPALGLGCVTREKPQPLGSSECMDVSALTPPAVDELRPDGVGHGTRGTSIQPLGNARYKIQFTASAGLREKLERLRALMRHEVPDGDLATIIDGLVSKQLERIEARRFAKASRPKTAPLKTAATPASRRIPAVVRRAVYERGGKQCGYVDASGRRCSERHRLEYHHRHPFAMGGDHDVRNVGLICRTHNAFVATLDYGREAMARRRTSGKAAHVINTVPDGRTFERPPG